MSDAEALAYISVVGFAVAFVAAKMLWDAQRAPTHAD